MVEPPASLPTDPPKGPISRRQRWTGVGLDAVLAVPIALAAILATGYQYALDDQVQYLAWAAHLRDPAGLAGDPYIDAFASLKSYVWHPIAWLVPERALPSTLLALTIASAWLSALLAMRLGRALRGGTLGALLAAAILIVPKEQNWFGLVALSDTEFTATLLGVPACLGVMLAIACRRPIVAVVIAACTLPIHAQTAGALLAACTLWLLLAGPSRPHRIVGLVLLVLGGALALGYRASRAMPADVASRVEAIGRQLYLELIDPSVAPLASWAAVFAIIACGTIAAMGLRTRAASLAGWSACSLAVPLAGIGLLAIGVQEPALWTLMLGRWLMLAQLAALVMVAAWAGTKRGPALLAAVVLCVWPTGEGTRVDAVLLGIALLLLAWSLLPRRAFDRETWLVLAVLVVAFAVSLDPNRRATGFAWNTSQHDAIHRSWHDVQRWAREHTPPEAAFLTPPYLAGWRVHSHRQTTAELRDGGIFFYADPSLLLAWHDRIERLGMDDLLEVAWTSDWEGVWLTGHMPTWNTLGDVARTEYAARVQDQHLAIGFGADYVVLEYWTPRPPWGQEVYANSDFIVLKVGP